MSLRGYVDGCRTLAQELRGSLSSEDVEWLRVALSTMTAADWIDWRMHHQDAVARFVAATPSQRQRRKSWALPETRRALTLAAIYHLQWAEAVLDRLGHLPLQPYAQQRLVASEAGLAYLTLLRDRRTDLWPLEPPEPFRPDED